MPGGAVEAREDPLTAVEREIREESGVVAQIEELFGVYSAPYRDDLVLLFTGRVTDQKAWLPNDEISEIGFFPLDALPVPMGPNPRLRFGDIIAGRRSNFCTFAEPGVRLPERSLPRPMKGRD